MPIGGHHEHGDLAQGRFSTAVVEKLFTASRYLFAVKPWTFVKAHQVLRMDIPTLGIDGACLSIIGQLRESRGVLIFPSLDGFERFLAAANAGRREHGAITMGTELLSLTFQHATELPPSMYREAMRNALPVESPDAYPLVAHRNPNGIPQPLGDRDLETATACALALSAFLPKYASIFQTDSFTRVCESYFDDDDREVRFTVPYEAIADGLGRADLRLQEPGRVAEAGAVRQRGPQLRPRRSPAPAPHPPAALLPAAWSVPRYAPPDEALEGGEKPWPLERVREWEDAAAAWAVGAFGKGSTTRDVGEDRLRSRSVRSPGGVRSRLRWTTAGSARSDRTGPEDSPIIHRPGARAQTGSSSSGAARGSLLRPLRTVGSDTAVDIHEPARSATSGKPNSLWYSVGRRAPAPVVRQVRVNIAFCHTDGR